MTEQEMQFELMKSQEKVNALRQEVSEMNKEREYWQHYSLTDLLAELTNPNNVFSMCDDKLAIITKRAIRYADALVAELQKKGGQDGNHNH